MTSGPEPRLFLQLDNGKEAPERLLVFGTDESLQLLAGSTSWFMDGTFSVVPYLFGQLYVIHGEVGTDRCPLLYALMQRQTQSSYKELFNFISLKCHADPSSITVDFEKCAHQAIRSVFGNDVAIRGCFYHLTQSTWRKIQNLGLTDAYKDNEEFRLFCGQLDSMALLPIDRVQEGMAHLKSNIPEVSRIFRQYVCIRATQMPSTEREETGIQLTSCSTNISARNMELPRSDDEQHSKNKQHLRRLEQWLC